MRAKRAGSSVVPGLNRVHTPLSELTDVRTGLVWYFGVAVLRRPLPCHESCARPWCSGHGLHRADEEPAARQPWRDLRSARRVTHRLGHRRRAPVGDTRLVRSAYDSLPTLGGYGVYMVTPCPIVTAHTFYKKWGSFSQPVLLGCSDGALYIVKGRQIGRAIVNEHVVARLADQIKAPVPPIAVVDVTQALIDIESQISHLPNGDAHGSRLVDNCSDRASFQYMNLQENRQRFAKLVILYSWVGVWSDHQFIYKNDPPHLVYSVDHGHFFQGGPNWTLSGLNGTPPAVIDNNFSVCGLTVPELKAAAADLALITKDTVAAIVGGVPDTWALARDEAKGLIDYLVRRRDQLIALLNHMS